MKNQTLNNMAKNLLKKNLAECTPDQQMMFKRMYSHKNPELPIDEVVDKMPDDKIDWAMTQVERTLQNNKVTAQSTR